MDIRELHVFLRIFSKWFHGYYNVFVKRWKWDQVKKHKSCYFPVICS